MKKYLVLVSGLTLSMCVFADNDTEYRDTEYSTVQTLRALPPIYQDLRDLDSMQQVLMSSGDIPFAGIQSINLDDNVIYFKNGCRAVFHRDTSHAAHPPGWVGPAAPLVLGSIVCDQMTK